MCSRNSQIESQEEKFLVKAPDLVQNGVEKRYSAAVIKHPPI